MRTSAEVIFDEATLVMVKQKNFFARNENTVRLIRMLIEKFTKRNHVALEADGDADTLICQTAIQTAHDGKAVIVVGEDIDL